MKLSIKILVILALFAFRLDAQVVSNLDILGNLSVTVNLTQVQWTKICSGLAISSMIECDSDSANSGKCPLGRVGFMFPVRSEIECTPSDIPARCTELQSTWKPQLVECSTGINWPDSKSLTATCSPSWIYAPSIQECKIMIERYFNISNDLKENFKQGSKFLTDQLKPINVDDNLVLTP